MADIAQGLEIGSIPEQASVSVMFANVVHVQGQRHLSALGTGKGLVHTHLSA